MNPQNGSLNCPSKKSAAAINIEKSIDNPTNTSVKSQRVPFSINRIRSVKMSRFFRGANDSSSDSSSSDEEELYSDEEEEEVKAAYDEEDSDEEEDDDDDDSSSEDEDGNKKTGINKFLKGGDSESEESSDEDRAKVVKSAKDKRLEELEGTVKAIENGEKINDWGVISNGMSF
jgi:hypothetical protein